MKIGDIRWGIARRDKKFVPIKMTANFFVRDGKTGKTEHLFECDGTPVSAKKFTTIEKAQKICDELNNQTSEG